MNRHASGRPFEWRAGLYSAEETRHPDCTRETIPGAICAVCGRRFAFTSRSGKQTYCGAACRQKAYRDRLRWKQARTVVNIWLLGVSLFQRRSGSARFADMKISQPGAEILKL